MGAFGEMERIKEGFIVEKLLELRFEELVRVESPDSREG